MDTHIDIMLPIKYNCRHVANFLNTIQFTCKIIPYITVTEDAAIDSCSIIFNNKSPAEIKTRLWKPLKSHFSLEDAQLHIPYIYSGPINHLD
jgi:hypothetical protein